MSVQELTRPVRTRWKLPAALSGVMVSRVAPLSPADEADLHRGDVIIEINRAAIRTAGDYRQIAAVAQARRRADVLRLRSGHRPARAPHPARRAAALSPGSRR